MKSLYIIYTSALLFACSGSSSVVESYSETGEKIVISENSKAELALVEIGKACKDAGYIIVSRGGSLLMSDGTRVVAKCGKEPAKSDKKLSFNQ